jgi:hypothetical protein
LSQFCIYVIAEQSYLKIEDFFRILSCQVG